MSSQQRELRREYERIWRDGYRRRRGVPVRKYRKPTVIDTTERVLLDRGPIVTLVRQSGIDHVRLSRMADVPERTVTRIMSGESRHVRVDVADKIAVALGMPLSLVYPEWLEAEAA